MKYSKLLSLLAASAIVASMFAGCQKAEQPVEEPKVEQKEEKTRTIGEESETSFELVNELDVDIESICISYGDDKEFTENLLLDEPVKAGEKVVLFYAPDKGDVSIQFVPKGDDNQYTVKLDKTEEIESPVVIKKDDDSKIIVTVEDKEAKEETVIEVKAEPVEKEEVKEEPKKEETKKEEAPKTETKKEETKPSSNSTSTSTSENTSKPSTNNNNSTNNTNNSNSNSNAGGSSNNTKPQSHTHSYDIPITTTVHHDAVTHQEQRLVSDAWDEPVYGSVGYVNCNGCGAHFNTTSEWTAHNKPYALNGDGSHGSYSVLHETVIIDYIHHDAVYETVTVTDSQAYDETVTTGYKCSCGATK